VHALWREWCFWSSGNGLGKADVASLSEFGVGTLDRARCWVGVGKAWVWDAEQHDEYELCSFMTKTILVIWQSYYQVGTGNKVCRG